MGECNAWHRRVDRPTYPTPHPPTHTFQNHTQTTYIYTPPPPHTHTHISKPHTQIHQKTKPENRPTPLHPHHMSSSDTWPSAGRRCVRCGPAASRPTPLPTLPSSRHLPPIRYALGVSVCVWVCVGVCVGVGVCFPQGIYHRPGMCWALGAVWVYVGCVCVCVCIFF
jgi:hypothetical protein